MEAIKSPCLARHRRGLSLLLAVSLSLAGGCAQIPRLDPPPAMKKVDELGSSNSFSAPPVAWPADGWWRAYGDPQLGALIEEALRDSPDLEMAKARLHGCGSCSSGRGRDAVPRGDRQCPAQRRQAEL